MSTAASDRSESERVGWFDAARRLQRVGFVLAKHGFGEVVARIGLAVPKLPFAEPRAPRPERFARRLAETLTELGPTYLKLGQLLATRVDLFPPEVIKTLATLHAGVRPMRFVQVEKTIERSLGRSIAEAFAHFEPECLAAASIGQVHRARLHDGTQVVVKVQRPGLEPLVQADLAIMRRLAALLAQHIEEIAAYDPVALVDAFERSIGQELDFRIEAENARQLREALQGAPEVLIPQIYASRTVKHVLVMEFVQGTPLPALAPSQRGPVRAALLRAFVRQAIDHGLFHADPHPGNILVRADGRVVLLDFGSIDRLQHPLPAQLLRVALALSVRSDAWLGDAMIAIGGARTLQIDRRRLRRELAALLGSAARGDGARVIEQVLAISRAHSLRLPAPLLALARMLALLDGVLRGLDPDRDVIADLRREFAWALGRRAGRMVLAPIDWVGHKLRRGVSWLRVRVPKVLTGP